MKDPENIEVSPEEMTVDKWESLLRSAGLDSEGLEKMRVVTYQGPLVIQGDDGMMAVMNLEHQLHLNEIWPELKERFA